MQNVSCNKVDYFVHNHWLFFYLFHADSIVVAHDLSQPPRHVLRSNLSTPNVFNVEEKAQFSISCTFDGFGSDFTLRMYKDDAVLPTPRIQKQFLTSPSRIRQTLTVEFEFSKVENSGTYRCVARNERQSVVTRNITLISGLLQYLLHIMYLFTERCRCGECARSCALCPCVVE